MVKIWNCHIPKLIKSAHSNKIFDQIQILLEIILRTHRNIFPLVCIGQPLSKLLQTYKTIGREKTEKILNLAICALWLPPGPQENVETNCNHQLSTGQKTWRRHWAMTSTKNQDLLKSQVSISPIWADYYFSSVAPLVPLQWGPQCYIGSMFYFCLCQMRMIWIK